MTSYRPGPSMTLCMSGHLWPVPTRSALISIADFVDYSTPILMRSFSSVSDHAWSSSALLALLWSLSLSTSLSLRVTETELDSDLMVVKFVCLAFEDWCPAQAPTYFATYQAAVMHVAKSSMQAGSEENSHWPTVVLPNRPADNEAGGSGSTGPWTGQNQNQSRQSDLAHPRPSGSSASRGGALASVPCHLIWYRLKSYADIIHDVQAWVYDDRAWPSEIITCNMR